MMRIRLIWFILAVVGLAMGPSGGFDPVGLAHAGHFPWDQGHDTTRGESGDEDTDPGDDTCNNRGSPFEVATGNFIYRSQDLFIPALGPDIEITRTYNSRDMRSGPFGHGWAFTYDQRLLETTDGVHLFVICRQGHGKRERFGRNPDGTYTPPPDLFYTLTKHPDGTFTLRGKHGTRRLFDAAGRLVALVDRNDNGMTFDYDETGFLTEVTDASGRGLVFTKGPHGKIASITALAERVYRYHYDDEGNLVGFTDPEGDTTQYVYDDKHNLVQVIAPMGRLIQEASYDEHGRLATLKEQERRWKISYFPETRKTVKKDSQGNTWRFFYNENGNIVRKEEPQGDVEEFSYSANFRLSSITENGKTCSMMYDDRGNIVSKTNALGYTTRFTYDPTFNYVTSFTDVWGETTRFAYDSNGNLTKIHGSREQVVELQYDENGRLTEVTDASGQALTSIQDTAGPSEGARRRMGDDPAKRLNQVFVLQAMCIPSVQR